MARYAYLKESAPTGRNLGGTADYIVTSSHMAFCHMGLFCAGNEANALLAWAFDEHRDSFRIFFRKEK